MRSLTASIIVDKRSSGFFFSGFSDLLLDDESRLDSEPPWPTVIAVRDESWSVDRRNREEEAIGLRASRVAMASDLKPPRSPRLLQLQASGGLSTRGGDLFCDCPEGG